MDFFESYKWVAEYQKFNFKKVAKVLSIIIVAYVILIIILSIKAGTMPDVHNELEKKFNNEIWIPILTKHNYQNIIIGKYGDIRDIEIGLMNGDERKKEKKYVACDKFKYSSIEYFHVERIEVEGKRDSDGYIKENEKTTFNGGEIYLPCITNIQKPIRIVPSEKSILGIEKAIKVMYKQKEKDEKHINVHDSEFDKNFEVFSEDPDSAVAFLNSEKIEILKELRKEENISVVINKDGVYVASDRISGFFEMPIISENLNITMRDFENEYIRFENVLKKYERLCK